MSGNFFELVAKLDASISALNTIISGGAGDSVYFNEENKPSISKAIFENFAELRSMIIGRPAFKTKSDLESSTGMSLNSLAEVWGDPVSTNNGLYGWNGSSWALSPISIKNSIDTSNTTIPVSGFAVTSEIRKQLTSKNLVDVSKSLKGKYIPYNGTGAIYNNPDSDVTDFIPILPGESIAIKNALISNPQGVYSYDKDFNWLRVDQVSNGLFVGVEGSAYIRFTYHIGKINSVMAEYGIGNGLYEPYSEKLKPSLIPALSEIYDKISNILTYVNLFNSETSVPGYVSASGALVLNNGFDVISDYIPLKSGQIISFSSGVRVSGSYGVNTYDANKQLINTSQYNGVSFTQGVDKSEFIKLSVDNTKLSTTMVNYGAELLPFEPYRAEISTSLLNKVYEYINSLIDSTDAEIISIEKNLFDKNSTVSPAFIEAAGNGSLSTYNPEFEVSDYIRLEEGQKLAVSGSVRLKSPFGIYTYDQNKNWIGVHQEQGDTITGRPGSSFVRVSVEIAKRDQMQVEYGDYPTAYQAYKRSLSPQYIPSYLNNNMRVVLPKKMYMKSNFTPSIYFDNITYSAQNAVKNIAFSKGTHLKNQWNFYDKKVGVIEPVSVVYKGEDLDNIIDSVSISVENVDIFVNAGKSINLLCVGDSFTDIGTWVKETKLLLESDGVLVNLIGTKGGAAAASESLSGGTMSKFLLNKYDTARVCTVSGIVSQPVTAYPGTKYIDGNGTEWTVCGTSLSNGAGRITLTYSGGGEPPVELPSSGVLTKSNTQQGDNSITYTSFTTANRNPFWNPGSSVALDFNYYCDFWGFPAPDILVLQFTYNDIASNVKNVAPTVLAAKQVIDAFHAQYPLAKVVFSIEPCGAKDNSYRLTDATNKAFLQFVEAMVLQFEDDAAYNSFVILAPSYAFVDRVNGYGPSSIIPNSRYPSIIEVYGGDGIHCNTAGMKQIADCVVPVIHKLLTI